MRRRRLKRLVIMGIITGLLVSLVISMLGTASLFLTIGGLKYLSTFMPAWKAWDITGLTSGVVGGVFFLALYVIIRNK